MSTNLLSYEDIKFFIDGMFMIQKGLERITMKCVNNMTSKSRRKSLKMTKEVKESLLYKKK